MVRVCGIRHVEHALQPTRFLFMDIPLITSFRIVCLAGSALLLPPLVVSTIAQDAVAKAAAEPAAVEPMNIEQLREQLLASLHVDLLALREKKAESSGGLGQLAQAVDILVRDLPEAGGAGGIPGLDRPMSWQPAVQAYGSEKSMKLGIELARSQSRDRLEQLSAMKARVELIGQRAAQGVFAAKSAPELDPILEEIAKFAPEHRLERMGLSNETMIRLQQLQQFIAAWQIHLAARVGGNSVAALQALRNLQSGERSPSWIPRSELSKQIAEAARLSGYPDAEQLSRKTNSMVEGAMSAATPEAIDGQVLEAKELQAVMLAYDQGNRSNQVQQVISFLESWQKAMIMREAGDASGFKEVVQQLENSSGRGLNVSRAKLLARLYEMNNQRQEPGKARAGLKVKETAPVAIESPEDVLARMRTLDDLDGNLKPLTDAVELTAPSSSQRSSWQRILSDLQNLARQYGEIQRGLATRVSLNIGSGEPSNPRVLDLQKQLTLKSLDRLFGEDAKMAPEAQDNAVTYLRRVLVAARERQDWRLAQRVMEVAQSTNVQDPLLKSTDSAALTAFIAGQTQEKARQFAFAAASYLGALKSGSEWVPVEAIGDRLAEIEKEHPAAYQQGVEWARTPPPQNYPPGYFPPNYGPGVQRSAPPRDGRPAGEQPVLIPEKQATPEKKEQPAAKVPPAATVADRPVSAASSEKAVTPPPKTSSPSQPAVPQP